MLKNVLKFPQLIPNALNFLACLRADHSHAVVPLLTSLVDSAISSSDHHISAHLPLFLSLFECASREALIAPEPVLSRLLRLYHATNIGSII
jgi:hypothetical protein